MVLKVELKAPGMWKVFAGMLEKPLSTLLGILCTIFFFRKVIYYLLGGDTHL